MSEGENIRWKQRLDQFERAYLQLVEALKIQSPSFIERAGIIQFFEMSFELSWKLLKDYQQAEGYDISSPRDAIKQAFQNGIITDGAEWMKALEDRNLTTHTYNESTALLVESKIRDHYAGLLQALWHTMKSRVTP